MTEEKSKELPERVDIRVRSTPIPNYQPADPIETPKSKPALVIRDWASI